MMAPKALQLGLIDQLGSQHDALKAIKKLANIQGSVKLLRVSQPTRLMSLLGADGDVEAPSFAQKTAGFLHEVWVYFSTYQACNSQTTVRQ